MRGCLFSPDRDHFQLGTLSHVLNMRTTGYQELPEWPEVAPDPAVRNVELPPVWVDKPSKHHSGTKKKQDLKSFYSESESSDEGERFEGEARGKSGNFILEVLNEPWAC